MPGHIASCQCGSLQLSADREADICIACNCKACQKRTGSAFATVAYIQKASVMVTGQKSSWARTADSGRDVESFFCPKCGTTVYWALDFRPDHFGVLIGAMDNGHPTPTRVVWESEKQPWVQFPDAMECFPKGSPAPTR